MSTVGPASVPVSRRHRSAVTNSSWLLDGVDNRKAAGRRYRDLCMAFADDLGGADKLTTAQGAMVRQLSGIIVEAERMQATIVRGEAVDHEQLIRISNAQARLMAQLGLRDVKSKEEAPNLHDYLASKVTA